MRIRHVAQILLAVSMAIGCSSQEYPGAERAAVSGAVTLDGKPVETGTVYLMPGSGVADGRISGASITDGAFQVSEAKGPNLGTYTLAFELTRPTGKYRGVDESGVPYDPIFQDLTPKSLARGRSEQTVDIQAGENVFEFAVTSDGKLSITRKDE